MLFKLNKNYLNDRIITNNLREKAKNLLELLRQVKELTDYIQTRCYMHDQNNDKGESPTTDLSRIEMDNVNR